MKRSLLIGCGILAPLLYIGTTLFGAAIRPGYSHIAMAISELTASGAPHKEILDPLFALYNLLQILFGIGLFNLAQSGFGQKRTGKIGAAILVMVGAAGLLMYFFPQEPGGTTVTLGGTLHIVLAGIMSFGTMGAIVLTGLWAKNEPGGQRFWIYSLISFGVVFLSGGLSAVLMANSAPFFGAVERVTIGAFEAWLLVTGLKLRAA